MLVDERGQRREVDPGELIGKPGMREERHGEVVLPAVPQLAFELGMSGHRPGV